MAFWMATGKAVGKHAVKTLEARADREKLLAQAMQQPEAAQAQAAIEREKSRRSRNRLIAGGMAVSLAVGGAGYALYRTDKGVRDFLNGIKSSTPKPETAVQIQNVLEKVSLPGQLLLVEGTGKGSASYHSRLESSAPVVGYLYNHTIAHDTDVTASAVRRGNAQLLLAGQALQLKGIQTADGWQIEADVNAAGISNQLADMHDAGSQAVNSHADLLVRTFNGNGAGSAASSVKNWADASFKNACSQDLLTDIPMGVEQQVRQQVEASAGLLDSLNRTSDAALLRRLASRPMKVVLYRDQTVRNIDGQGPVTTRRVIAPDDMLLPLDPLPHSTANTRVDYSGQCLLTPSAMHDQLAIHASEGNN